MDVWGHLNSRYEAEQPRKVLALDGGGIRGMLTLEILAEMERQLKKEHFGFTCLGDYFDYIGGTSTGAIIAAGLSIGMTTEKLIDFYRESGSDMFDKTSIFHRVATLVSSLYQSEPLADKLKEIFHDGPGRTADLTSERLRCLLLVVTKNMTTDSPWPVSSNPRAKYNDRSRPDCNLSIPLWQLVRASTAAPVYFPPEVVCLDPKKPNDLRVFVDGGMTPYNNPSFLMFRMATLPEYKLSWKTGESNLLIVSVGTGASANVSESTGRNVVGNIQNLPGDLMYSMQVDQDINCRTFGRCVHGAEIDREVGDLVLSKEQEKAAAGGPERMFRYARYNADLSQKALDKLLGAGQVQAAAVQQLDAVDQIDNLSRIGKAIAGHDVRVKEHFGPFVSAR